MALSDRMIHKSKSLSLRDNKYKGIIDKNISTYTDDGYVTQNNESNHSVNRKSSFKNKLFSLFKTHSKHANKNTSITIDNNARCSLTRASTNADSTHSTISNNQISQSQIKNEQKEKLDPLDQQLIERFSLHTLTESIIDSVNELPCSSIKLPSTWITNIGSHLSNRALQPFLTSIPGILGLKNHGNTCYVNVIVQCLAHIDSVAQYFSTKDYLFDLRISAKENSYDLKSKSGSSLDVVIALSYLLQSLWQYTYNSNVSIKFCQLLSLHKTQFSTDSQQDAHELLLYILNLLHDNLVRPGIDSSEESSFIYDRFCGWLSNQIICPKCGYSRKFRDKMLSLNLPIRKKTTENNEILNMIFYIILLNGNQPGEQHAFEIDKSATVIDIRRGIAERLCCGLNDILIIELVDSGFGRLYSDDRLINDIFQSSNHSLLNNENDIENGLYAVYIPNQVVDVDALPLNMESSDEIYRSVRLQKEPWSNQSFIRLLVVHVEKTKEYFTEFSEELRRSLNFDPLILNSTSFNSRLSLNQSHFIRFTNVLTVQAARKTKLGLLRHSLSEQMCKYLNLRNVTKLPKPQFLIEGSHIISELDSYPLLDHSVTMALKESTEIFGEESAVVRLVVVWPYRTIQMLRLNRRGGRDNIRDSIPISLNLPKTVFHHSVKELSVKVKNRIKADVDLKEKESKITITDCLREFFGLDSLSVTESWNCPSCETTQQAHTKIKIESAPETLILMLKRFSNDKIVNNEGKIDEGVLKNQQSDLIRRDTFQRRNFIKRRNDYLNKLDCFIDYPLENLDMKEYVEHTSDNENYMYNLVAVVNHRGNLSNGHYVAMCQNSIDSQWRMYDDDRVTDISRSDVVHPDAYILFYKRQCITSELNPDLNLHWSYRRLSFPDKVHINQSPNPTSLYYKHRRYSEKEVMFKSKDSYGTLPLTVSNNHNSTYSLNNRLNAVTEWLPSENFVTSPHLSSSSDTSLAKLESATSPVIDEGDHLIDITTITSDVVNLELCDLTDTHNGFLLKRNESNGSSESAHEDSGAVMSQASSCPTNHKRQPSLDLPLRYHDDESYSSFSTSPSTSSPNTSKKLPSTVY